MDAQQSFGNVKDGPSAEGLSAFEALGRKERDVDVRENDKGCAANDQRGGGHPTASFTCCLYLVKGDVPRDDAGGLGQFSKVVRKAARAVSPASRLCPPEAPASMPMTPE